MPDRHDTYGFKTLGIELEERESSYRGASHSRSPKMGAGFRLYRNSGEHVQSAADRDYPVLLDVSALDDMDEIRSRLMRDRIEPVLLQTRTLDSPEDDEAE